ncbi:MAG TPA: site-specific DNA-methyltransferase [Firmicutes bacterium]|nr:site-specific DNA-methyltransferase [Candidatus Fermentithermobacillaceae bacterium]
MPSGENPFSNQWQTVSSRWGHRLHAMCSYMAMFPPNLPHYFISRCTEPGDLVLDPFCGRGTTPLEACLLGRVGIGNDMNELAYALTKAKTHVPPAGELTQRLSQLAQGYQSPPEARSLLQEYQSLSGRVAKHQQQYAALYQPGMDKEDWERLQGILTKLRQIYATLPGMPYYRDEEYDRTGLSSENGYTEDHHHSIWLFFHPDTLRQLVYLKSNLGSDSRDAFIRAVVLGILHGRGRFYLSLPMPNTFSLTPRYTLSYSYRHRLILPHKDVFQCLKAKLQLLGLLGSSPRKKGIKKAVDLDSYVPGEALKEDIRNLPEALAPVLKRYGRRPRLLVTSPPYLGVIRYGLYNWIRFWFRESGSETGVGLDDGHKTPESYLAFMTEAMRACHDIMDDHSLSAWVIGDVTARGIPHLNLAEAVWEHAAKPEGWNLLGVITDEVMDNRKVTKIWGESRGRATRVDRVLLLYKKSWPDLRAEVAW